MEQVTQADREAANGVWVYHLLKSGPLPDWLVEAFAAHRRTTNQAKDEEIARLVEELRLWRMLVNEGGVPRYTITPGAALNTIVTSTDGFLRRYPDA